MLSRNKKDMLRENDAFNEGLATAYTHLLMKAAKLSMSNSDVDQTAVSVLARLYEQAAVEIKAFRRPE